MNVAKNWALTMMLERTVVELSKCDPPQEFDAKGESALTTRLHDTLSVP